MPKQKYIVWFFLVLPGLLFTIGFLRGTSAYDVYMHSTGEFSARFLIFTLIATPLRLMFPKGKFPRFLLRNRRYFGLAAFGYGVLHLVAYLAEIPLSTVFAEFFKVGLLTAWLAFIIWIPLAITSNNAMVRKLKRNWKKLQRFTYPAALLVVLHWSLIHYNWKPAMVHFLPVLLLQLYRLWKQRKQKALKEELIYK